MVKLFVGNIADGVSEDQLKELFVKHGTVTECCVMGSYGFVHMSTDAEAEEAIKLMDKFTLQGRDLNVQKSKRSGMSGGPKTDQRRSGNGFGSFTDNSAEAKAARRAGCTKLHVASLADGMSNEELRGLFERYGYVAECDLIEDKGIAFVHIESGAADAAIRGLNGRQFRGVSLKVQMSLNQNRDARPESYGPSHRGGFGRGRGGYGEYGRGRGFDSYMGGPVSGRGRALGAYEGGYGDDGYGGFGDVGLPPAKSRVDMLEMAERRRRLEALDPYERRLILCPDPFNLPPPSPEYLRLLRERAMVKARLPQTAGSQARASPIQSASGAQGSVLQRALIARRAAAVAASAREKLRSSAAVLDPYSGEEASRAAADDYLYGGLSGY